MDGDQAQPEPTDGEGEALEQSGIIHQRCKAGKARAGDDEHDHEGDSREARVARPIALA